MRPVCNYTFKHYAQIVALAKKQGYAFLCMKDYDATKEKVIYMRHDIDVGVRNALEVAKLEKGLGIRSTYFVRLHADYNPFSFENFQRIKKISDMGHEIGLHFFPGFATAFKGDMKRVFDAEVKLLSEALGKPIHGYAFHEPERTKPGAITTELYDAYDPKFVKDIKYISDSGGKWREGCACEAIKSGYKKLCILTHPMWWYSKVPIEGY